MYSGLTAKLSIMDGTVEKDISYISNFSIEETRDIVEITKLGSKTKEKLPTMYSWSASADGTADFEPVTSDAATENPALVNQTILRSAMKNGTKVKVRFYLSTDRYLEGEAYIESLSLDIAAEDKCNISISLSGIDTLEFNDENSQPSAPVEGNGEPSTPGGGI